MHKITFSLFLSTFIAFASASTSSLFLGERYHTGYVDIDTRGSAFYWLFKSRKEPCRAPLVIYLDDIQAWASQLLIFLESGPYRINQEDNTLTRNPYSWNKIANVLYVDVKLGTGFSVVDSAEDIPNTHSKLADDIYTFLLGFIKQHPEYKGRDLYIRSRAQGAKPLAFLGALLLDNAKKLKMKFKGFLIASPRFSDQDQIDTIPQFGFENGLINQTEYKTLQDKIDRASDLMSQPENEENLFEADTLYYEVITDVLHNNTINFFDIRKPCVESDIVACYDVTFIRKFLLQQKVTNALRVRDAAVSSWTESNSTVWFTGSIENFYASTLSEMSRLVQRGVPILFYSGDKASDYDWIGAEKIANLLEWDKQEEFVNKRHTKWGSYGDYKQVDNLVVMKVYNSGFFVGMDQPKTELAIIERMIKGW